MVVDFLTLYGWKQKQNSSGKCSPRLSISRYLSQKEQAYVNDKMPLDCDDLMAAQASQGLFVSAWPACRQGMLDLKESARCRYRSALSCCPDFAANWCAWSAVAAASWNLPASA